MGERTPISSQTRAFDPISSLNVSCEKLYKGAYAHGYLLAYVRV
jgi:hypothetical protein